MSKNLVGLDIACSNLKLVELGKQRNGFLVKKAAYLEREEELINPDFTNSNLKSAAELSGQITKAYKTADIKLSSVSLSIPAKCVRLFFLSFNEINSNQKDMGELIRWQISKQLPATDFKAVISYQVIENQSSDNYSIMAVVAGAAVINEYVSLLARSGKQVEKVTVDFLAAYNYFEEYLQKFTNYLFVYAGYDTTSLLFFQKSKPVFYHQIDIGGRDYTASLALNKRLSLTEANQYKKKELFFPDAKSNDPKILENFTLIKEVNEKLFKKIHDSQQYFLNSQPKSTLTQVFLSGEGLAFSNIAQVAEKFLGLNCQHLKGNSSQIKSSFNLEELYPAIGLLLGE